MSGRSRAGAAAGSFGHKADAPPPASSQAGLTFADALRTRQLWLVGLALTVTGGGVVGLIVHLVPLLTDQGMSLSSAAKIASAISIGAIVSGGAGGFLLDRVFAR